MANPKHTQKNCNNIKSPLLIHSLVFDMDGVIIDSEPMQLAAFNEALHSNGVELSAEDFIRWCVGRKSRENFVFLREHFGLKQSVEELLLLKNRAYQKRLHDQITPMRGLLSLLDTLKGQGIPLAVASSSRREDIELVLSQLGIRNDFAVVVSGEEVTHGKPEPDIFLEAARRLGVEPATCLVLEDTQAGTQAAVRAGMRCVAVPNHFTLGQDFSQAFYLASDLEDVQSLMFNPGKANRHVQSSSYFQSTSSSLSPTVGENEFLYSYRGSSFRFLLHPNVAKPNYYSFFLMETLDINSAKSVLDVGTGIGFIALLIAGTYRISAAATDLNPFAVELSWRNAQLNGLDGNFRIRHGSLFKPFENECFDLVICDPPFAPTPQDLIELLRRREDWFYCNACGGTDGREIIAQVIDQARAHLTPNGRLVLVHPDYVNIDQTFEEMTQAGLKPLLISQQWFPLGVLGTQRKSYIEAELGFRFTKVPDGTIYQLVAVIEGSVK